jgi:hypothetical protein
MHSENNVVHYSKKANARPFLMLLTVTLLQLHITLASNPNQKPL